MKIDEARLVLGIEGNATEEDIRRSFRQKVLEAHPDRGGSEEQVTALIEARDLLLQEPSASTALATTAAGSLAPAEERAIRAAERSEHRAVAKGIAERLTLRQVSPLRTARNTYFLISGIGALATALFTAVERVSVLMKFSPLSSLAFTGSVTALSALLGLIAQQRVQRIQMAMEETMHYLDSKADCADLLSAVLADAGPPPWGLSRFGHFLSRGLRSHAEAELPPPLRGTLRQGLQDLFLLGPLAFLFGPRRGPLAWRMLALLRQMGPDDFARLVLAKGMEHGVLKEVSTYDEGAFPKVAYAPATQPQGD